MATYSLVQAVSGNQDHMCEDGSNLYVLTRAVSGVNYKVYKYDVSLASLTDISGNTFLTNPGLGQGTQLEWFDGNLYAVIPSNTTTINVYKWDGPGTTTWASVDSQAVATGFANSDQYIAADTNRIAWVLQDGFNSVFIFRASTDGTAWGNQTTPHSKVKKLHYDADRGELLAEDDGGTGVDMETIHWSTGATWTALNGVSVDTKYTFVGTVSGYQFYDDLTLPSATCLQRSVNYGVGMAADGLAFDSVGGFMQIHYLGNTGVCIWPQNANPGRIYLWDTGIPGWVYDGPVGIPGALMRGDPCRIGDVLYLLRYNSGIWKRDTDLDPLVPAGDKEYTVGLSPWGMDVSADSHHLYVAVLLAGNPVLLRLLADLSTAPIASYEPGAGDSICVKCGDLNVDWVWITGDFGTPMVRVSINDGTDWVTKDPGTWTGSAQPPVIGPYDDNLVLVPTDGDDDLFESEDGGLSWATLNAALAFDVGGIDRLDINLDEIIIGSRVGKDVLYSPNNGQSFHDITSGAMAGVAITDIIIG